MFLWVKFVVFARSNYAAGSQWGWVVNMKKRAKAKGFIVGLWQLMIEVNELYPKSAVRQYICFQVYVDYFGDRQVGA